MHELKWAGQKSLLTDMYSGDEVNRGQDKWAEEGETPSVTCSPKHATSKA